MFGRLLVVLSMATAVCFAQGDPDMGGRGGGGGGGGRGMGDVGMGAGMPRRQPPSKPEQVADKLKLNKEQKEEFERILAAGREEARPVLETMMKMRAQLATVMLRGGAEADLKKATEAYTGAAAQMTAIETKAFGKLYAALKPNQQGKAAQAFELMAGIFEPRIGGGGRGMGRGPGRQQ